MHTLVYNAGSGVWGTVEEIDVAVLESAFRVNASGLLLAAKSVIPSMKRQGEGNIIVIGATSSRRGVARTAAFAPAKAAQKSLTESLARHLWPQNIHVCLVIVDGVVDLPRTRSMLKDKPDDFFVDPDDLADTAFHLTNSLTRPGHSRSRRDLSRKAGEGRPLKETLKCPKCEWIWVLPPGTS